MRKLISEIKVNFPQWKNLSNFLTLGKMLENKNNMATIILTENFQRVSRNYRSWGEQ